MEEGEGWALFKMSTGTRIALGLAAFAVILVAIFLVVVYLRIKCTNTTPLQMARRALGQWTRATPPGDTKKEQVESETDQDQEQGNARAVTVALTN